MINKVDLGSVNNRNIAPQDRKKAVNKEQSPAFTGLGDIEFTPTQT